MTRPRAVYEQDRRVILGEAAPEDSSKPAGGGTGCAVTVLVAVLSLLIQCALLATEREPS